MPYYRIDGVSTDTHFAWVDECVQRGLYLLGHHNHFVSTAHSSADIERACEIADAAFKAIVENGQISSRRPRSRHDIGFLLATEWCCKRQNKSVLPIN